jgi:hypothetical protein
MAIGLKDAETDRLAREVARLTGESLTEAIRNALQDGSNASAVSIDPARDSSRN